MVGRFQDGWLCVIWKWNKSVCAWEYCRSVMGGVDGDRCGGVCCLLEVPERCSCQVNILQCTFEGVQVVGINALDRSLFHCAIVRGKKLYL